MCSRPSPASSSEQLTPLLRLYAEALARLRASRTLRRSGALWLAAGLLCSEALAVALTLVQGGSATEAAALSTLVWWAAISAVFIGGAAMLVTPDGAPVDRYGVPNGLTALRAWLCVPILLIAWLPFPGRTALALWAGVGGAVGLLDAVDGFIARSVGPITALGKGLDPFMDALFFLSAAFGCYLLGITTLWLSILIAVRYAAPLLVTPFVFLARRRPELVHTVWGRRNTLLTGVVFFVLFWVRAAGGPVWIAALVFGLPALVPTAVLHFIALARRVAAAPVAA
ncbi:MAG: CDP-alcohol phosphatidyltransferase family protein [Candidatus Dormibacteraeota bacterium]|nr:CDP-alcohol phosphatidyltransferase family protein [Candidatus Dormibacteraeota bacterium]MBV9524627.1 CDP-alcohol phosphatidyltransferase family protein [Candidatus Dormibacteraeota bacterium]